MVWNETVAFDSLEVALEIRTLSDVGCADRLIEEW